MGVLIGKKRKWIDYLCGTAHIVSAIFPSSSAVMSTDEAEIWMNKPELLALS